MANPPDPKGSLSLEGMSAELYQTLQALNLLRVHLVGLSLGGMVAQMLAVDHPSFVSSLTLCDTRCDVGPPQAQVLEERARAVEEGGMSALVKSILERWFSPGFSARRPDVVAEVEKLLLAADPVVNAQTWRAIARLNVASRLPNLHLPALVINGSLDNSIPPGEGERLAKPPGGPPGRTPRLRTHGSPRSTGEIHGSLGDVFVKVRRG